MSEPILPVGKQSGICVHDGSEWRKAKGDADGHQQVDIVSLPDVAAGVRAGQIQSTDYNGVPGDTAWHTLTTITTRARIISIDLVSNHSSSGIRLTGKTLLSVGADAAAPQIWPGVFLSDLQDSGGESSLFRIGVFDTTNNYYSLFLKREFESDSIFTIEYQAGSTTADVGVSITWVELS